jgi:hypothetical protein
VKGEQRIPLLLSAFPAFFRKISDRQNPVDALRVLPNASSSITSIFPSPSAVVITILSVAASSFVVVSAIPRPLLR